MTDTAPTPFSRERLHVLKSPGKCGAPGCAGSVEAEADRRRAHLAISRGRYRSNIAPRPIAVLVAVLLVATVAVIACLAYRMHTTEARTTKRLRQLNASFGRSAVGPPWLTGWLMRHNLPVIKCIGGIDAVDPAFCDSDLELLRGSSRIGYLDLDRTQVTDAGMLYLQTFSRLTILELDSTRVTDLGLASLKGLTALRVLTLYDTQITDTGLVHLRNLKGLRQLDLGKTHVTDEGLSNLAGFGALERLNLEGTHATKDGIERLKRALPNAEVHGP
jgi:hypothetical protein